MIFSIAKEKTFDCNPVIKSAFIGFLRVVSLCFQAVFYSLGDGAYFLLMRDDKHTNLDLHLGGLV